MTEGFFAFQPPAEVVERMREQAAHAQMHRQDDEHAIRDLLEGLDKDELITLRMILQRSRSKQINAYYQGRIEAILDAQHGVCVCGGDHTVPPEQVGESFYKGQPVEDVQTIMDPEEKAEMEEETADQVVSYPGQMLDMEDVIEAERLMEQYTLEPDPLYGESWDPETSERSLPPSKFRCTVCGMGYSSLEDRMRRPAGIDGCTGCQRKSAQG